MATNLLLVGCPRLRMAPVKFRSRDRRHPIYMSAPVMHETVETANLAELARSEEELAPVLAVLPQIPRVEAVIAEPVSDLILSVETVRLEPVLEKVAPLENIGSQPVPEQIPPIETISSKPVPEKIAQAETTNPKPLSEFALDLVLNEIVLQARLTTNATGAVFGLARFGELVCRATTGATASNVAVCLNAKSGIAATCFSTGAVRRVDDLGPDPNPDAVAYRNSGVRSILVVPVQGEKGPLLGILEIFSPRANAFCDRDVLTLQALARRIAANVELIQKSFNHQDRSSANAQPRDSAFSEPINSNNQTLNKARRMPRRLGTAQLWSLTSEQGSRLASFDWISILAKSAIALVLIAGSLSARSCWQRSGEAKFIQLIGEPMSHTAATPVQHVEKSIVSNTVPVSMQHVSMDPSTWLPKASAHPGIGASVTIQRRPLHIPKPAEVAVVKPAAIPGANGNVVLLDNHKTVSKDHIAQQAKLASTDPAASVLPNKIGTGDGGPEVLPTKAAMARLVQRVEPEYPNAARQQHIQGTVLIDVTVGATGAVEALSLVSGESQLMAAAEQAVRQWKFQPLIKDGKAEKFESRIAIDFTLVFEGPSGSH